MERAFRIVENSDYYNELKIYEAREKKQNEFIKDFFTRKEIGANLYRVGGNGLINRPFDEYSKKDICLHIVPTDKDIEKFDSVLNKEQGNGTRRFKTSSKIAKEFAQECIKKEIVINLKEPSLRDYFTSLSWSGFSITSFQFDKTHYLKINSKTLSKDETPEGFEEINLSEYHLKLEKLKESKKNK